MLKVNSMESKIDHILREWEDSYIGYDTVYMPPNWKSSSEIPYTFVYVREEINVQKYYEFFKLSFKEGLSNPRIITPRVLGFSSLFHPTFYHSAKNNFRPTDPELNHFFEAFRPMEVIQSTSSELLDSKLIFYLQSLTFLSGVTLSAAIIQNRWSKGTIESKLNRLWQVGCLVESAENEALIELNICDFVLETANKFDQDPLRALFEIKLFYSKVLSILTENVSSEVREINEAILDEHQEKKYGFVPDLKSLLGDNLETIILYGSATNSETFADYDLIIIVNDLELGLEALAGKSPMYNGLELNISLFEKDDFWTYQLASGDNLLDHSLCLYGQASVPHKSSGDLLARNFSFGFIRFRQQLGMASYANEIKSDSDDKKNLLDYFIKIPLNVSKGIQGCTGSITTNEELRKWFIEILDFDVDHLRKLSHEGNHVYAISTAAWATQEVMYLANQKIGFFQPEMDENIVLEYS